MDKRNFIVIQRLVQKIDQKLGWGSGQEWRNKEFEVLSEQIRWYTFDSSEIQKKGPPVDKRLFAFESKVVSTGLPNSVIFAYDASSADSNAQIEIQQDWDDRKRIEVSQKDSIATCIYYRPGFFKSKLVVFVSFFI